MRCGRTTAQVQRHCPDVERARAAFVAFDVPPGRRLDMPAEVRAYLRLVLSRSRRQVARAGPSWWAATAADWSGYVLLDGRRTIGAPSGDRIRTLVERLEARARRARDDFAAVLVDRLNRPTTRQPRRRSTARFSRS